MKKLSLFLVIVLSLFSIFINDVYSQEIEDEIRFIRSNYLTINKELDSYNKVDYIDVLGDINPTRYSMEDKRLPSVVIINCYKYFKDDALKKIVVTFDGEYNFQTSEYYIWNNKLFFVFKTNTQYLKPRWSENITEKDKKIIENRYYIKEDKIIRWLNEKKQIVLDKDKIKAEEEMLIHDYKLYLTINQNDIGPAANLK